MDGLKLDLSSLRDKVSSKLKGDAKPNKKDKKQQQQQKNNKDDKKKDNKKTNGSKNKEQQQQQQKPSKTSQEPEGESMENILRREALELGATEEDLKLLKDINDNDDLSEEEFDFKDDQKDDAFGSDLQSFMKGLGFSGKVDVVEDKVVEQEEGPAPVTEDEEEEDEEEEELEEIAEEEEEEKEEEEEDEEAEPESKEPEDFDEPEEELEEEDLNIDEETGVFQAAPLTDSKELPTHRRVEATTILDTTKLLIQPQVDWYNVPIGEPSAENLTSEQIEKLYARGKDYLEAENKAYYDEFSKTSSQRKFLSQMLTDGTLSDKISALTLLIQEAPLHNTKSFDTLLGFTNKKSRNSALQSLNALKDLFINGLLPDRKLRYFKNQPLSLMASKKQLAVFYFEDYLKKFYFQIIQVLEKLSHDPIIHVRMNVVSHIFDLLKAKPEQEVNLLKLGVNKIGDIDNKVSSKTSYQILQLEQAHPNMKKIVIDSVIDVTFKKNNDYHSKYYSILTLNQTILTRREEDIANELVKTYFALFEKLLIESDPDNVDAEEPKDTKANNYKNKKKNFKKGKKGGKSVKVEKTEAEIVEEKNSKLFSALLTGLNRAFPFSNLPNEVFSKHLDTLFKITHSSNFNTSIQALVLIYQITSSQKLNNDRFYRTLYESLFDTRLVTSSKQGIYLNLLFKALKQDTEIPRVLAFVKRIVQICYNWLSIGSISGLFYLLMELEQSIPQLRNLVLNTPVDYKFTGDDEVEADEEEGAAANKAQSYDGRKRDPRFANAETSSLWEINEFLNHYHPTVQLYAESFLSKTKQAKPDLGLFTLSHFLDRFVYRNAKAKPTTKGSSIMQPLGGAHTGSLLVKASTKFQNELPANTEDWFSKKTDEIRPDEMFFHQYFTNKDKSALAKLNDPQPGDFDNESDLDDEEVWDALVKSQPDIDGEEGSELDDMSDLDADDFSDLESDEEEEQELAAEDEDEQDGEEDGEIELQTIGMSDDDDEEEEIDEEIEARAEPEFNGFSESEDEEAQLFKGDSEDEYGSDEAPSDVESEPETASKSKKRPASSDSKDQAGKKSKKAKLRDLPVFASADDYAQYLNSDEE